MPLIYGKTVMAMSKDISLHYESVLGRKECGALASLINTFFKAWDN